MYTIDGYVYALPNGKYAMFCMYHRFGFVNVTVEHVDIDEATLFPGLWLDRDHRHALLVQGLDITPVHVERDVVTRPIETINQNNSKTS
jgi:hypothetical protein